jgi:LysM repeat protein
MKQRDKTHTLEADFRVDFSDEKGYSIRRKNKGNRFAEKLPGKSVFPFLIGAFTVGLVFLVAGVFLRSNNVEPEIKLRSLENRIKQLEDKSNRIDWLKAKLEEIEEENRQLVTFMDTFRKPETSPKAAITQTTEKQTKAIYHEVAAGETLYSISRRYRLTVEELLRLNRLKPGEVIRPKQRLLVRPAGNQ